MLFQTGIIALMNDALADVAEGKAEVRRCRGPQVIDVGRVDLSRSRRVQFSGHMLRPDKLILDAHEVAVAFRTWRLTVSPMDLQVNHRVAVRSLRHRQARDEV